MWLLALGAFVYWGWRVAIPRQIWIREHPLSNPLAIAGVSEGFITLDDGRKFKPAGIRRHDRVNQTDYDRILEAVVAQGVKVVRDLGDHRALLVAEPKFYNWCGTYNSSWLGSTRWAGTYHQVPVSELLIAEGVAEPDVGQLGLTALERWRLQGVRNALVMYSAPDIAKIHDSALRYGGWERELSNLDESLTDMVGPPPKP